VHITSSRKCYGVTGMCYGVTDEVLRVTVWDIGWAIGYFLAIPTYYWPISPTVSESRHLLSARVCACARI